MYTILKLKSKSTFWNLNPTKKSDILFYFCFLFFFKPVKKKIEKIFIHINGCIYIYILRKEFQTIIIHTTKNYF